MQAAFIRGCDAHRTVTRLATKVSDELDEVTLPGVTPTRSDKRARSNAEESAEELTNEDSLVTAIGDLLENRKSVVNG